MAVSSDLDFLGQTILVNGEMRSVDTREKCLQVALDLRKALTRTEDHLDILNDVMSEIKSCIDHWGEDSETIDGGEKVHNDIERLKTIMDYAVKSVVEFHNQS